MKIEMKLVSIQDSVGASMQRLNGNTKKCCGRLIKATRKSSDTRSINRIKIIRK